MLSVDFTAVWTAVNLLILFLFLKKFLFSRLGKVMDERTRLIEEGLKNAEKTATERAEFEKNQERLNKEAQQERASLLQEARQKAAKEGDAIIAEARASAASIVERAQQEIESERNLMLKTLRGEISSLVIAAATKIVEENMDNDKNRHLVEEFLSKEGAA
jgi:F-type H+-transporting ATPase subunit b